MRLWDLLPFCISAIRSRDKTYDILSTFCAITHTFPVYFTTSNGLFECLNPYTTFSHFVCFPCSGFPLNLLSLRFTIGGIFQLTWPAVDTKSRLYTNPRIKTHILSYMCTLSCRIRFVLPRVVVVHYTDKRSLGSPTRPEYKTAAVADPPMATRCLFNSSVELRSSVVINKMDDRGYKYRGASRLGRCMLCHLSFRCFWWLSRGEENRSQINRVSRPIMCPGANLAHERPLL